MTTRDGVGYHKFKLAEFDAACFFCLLPECYPASDLCLIHILRRLRNAEKRAGGDMGRVLETLGGKPGLLTTTLKSDKMSDERQSTQRSADSLASAD